MVELEGFYANEEDFEKFVRSGKPIDDVKLDPNWDTKKVKVENVKLPEKDIHD
jgi:hypothetical protein